MGAGCRRHAVQRLALAREADALSRTGDAAATAVGEILGDLHLASVVPAVAVREAQLAPEEASTTVAPCDPISARAHPTAGAAVVRIAVDGDLAAGCDETIAVLEAVEAALDLASPVRAAPAAVRYPAQT